MRFACWMARLLRGDRPRTSKSLRITDIETILGVDGSMQDTRWPLPRWYLSIRDKHLCELSEGDIARLIRQRIYLDFVIPEAVARLRRNPIAGDMCFGEILWVLARVEVDYWRQHRDLKSLVSDLAQSAEVNDTVKVKCAEGYGDLSEFTQWLDALRAELPNPKVDPCE